MLMSLHVLVPICVKDPYRYYDSDIVFEAAGVANGPVPRRKGNPREQSSKEPTRVRVEFPETWLWSESIAGYHFTPAVNYAVLCHLYAEFNACLYMSWCRSVSKILTGTTRRTSCLRRLMWVIGQPFAEKATLEGKVRRSQWEYAWNSRKLGCGPSQLQGTILNRLLSMLHSAGASAEIISDPSPPSDGIFKHKI